MFCLQGASRVVRGGLMVLALAGFASNAQAQVVRKTVDPMETATWKAADDNSAGGGVTVKADVPAELPASKGSLNLESRFSGKAFEFYRGLPVQPVTIPGVAKSVSIWVKAARGQGWVLQFRDGWGRTEANGGKLEWELSREADGTWKKRTFAIPANWVQPVTITGIQTHNWGQSDKQQSVHLQIDNLEVETDITDVDPETGVLKSWRAAATPANPGGGAVAAASKPAVTPLLEVGLAGSQPNNVFAGTRPHFQLTARNWRVAPANGTLQWKITDVNGAAAGAGTSAVSVEDSLTLPLPLDVSRYGVYKFDTSINWVDGKKTASSQSFALIPTARQLTDAEKDASPYGINVHSARGTHIGTLAKAGIIWYRDYAFDFSWVQRSKGADKSYGGWPYYPKIVRQYDDNGVRLLANMKGGITAPAPGRKPEPDLQWIREIVGIETAFPTVKTFELDNEYDLHAGNAKAEAPNDWLNYRKYHKKFGEVTRLIGGGDFLAVENGRAGIWPERIRRAVQSGDFADIDVVNSHHYAGTDPPELNVINHNMGFGGDENVLSFFDQLRAAKKAGAADGRNRQHWLTEFGWDTKAGPIVSEQQQAAYLSRAYMMLAAAGTEKGFWYWDLDAAVGVQFFDGCGLFTSEWLPKPAYASFAGLTQLLPKAQYLGLIGAGENTWGYLFRNEGKLVASLWTLDGSKGPAVDFGGAKLYDAYANPLQGSKAELGLFPVFAVGVDEGSRFAKQSAYSLETPYLVTATAGDTITANLQVKNTRSTPISGKVRLQLPAGWTESGGEAVIAAAPGQTTVVPLTFRINPDEPLGEKTVRLNISEGEPLQMIPLRVQIQRPLLMTIKSITGEPGDTDITVRVSNRSAKPMDGTLRLALPATWSTATPEIKVDALKPMEVRDVPAKLKWSAGWAPGEQAVAVFRSTDGRTVSQPIIPGRLTIAKAPALTIDGDLKDWPVKTKLPSWVLGSTVGEADADAYMAWSEKGLYVAVDVRDSKATVPDPRSFWVGDVLELFLDTHADKTTRKFKTGDHQFWFAPQPDQKRVYAGQWKRNEEIPATRFDLTGIQSAAARKGDGYVMEFLLPASLIQDYKPTAGGKLGLNLNLTVKSPKADREVFWTLPKSEGVDQPATWGTVTLGN